jgi:hypothetical protein
MMPRKIKRKDNLTKPIQPIANAPADFFVGRKRKDSHANKHFASKESLALVG